MGKIKVSEIEIIVTGKKEKPYFEIKYREVGNGITILASAHTTWIMFLTGKKSVSR